MNKTERPIPVLEIFGPTVQGEGMSIGRKTMFVRTAGCDYRCSWCDSAFTWDGSAREEIRLLSPASIWEELKRIGADRFDHVTLSGGNPLLLPQLGALVRLLRENGIRTAIETQGSVWQDWVLEIDEITLSPKPPSSGMTTDLAQLDQWITRLTEFPGSGAEAIQTFSGDSTSGFNRSASPAFSLKIVIFDQADLDFAAGLHRRYPQVQMILQTGNSNPTGGTAAEVAARLLSAYERLIEQVTARTDLTGIRILPQLHALVWGNKRGV